jgi:hypothetical protein
MKNNIMKIIGIICLLALSGCDMFNALIKEELAYNLTVQPVESWAALKQAVEDPDGPALIGVKGNILTPATNSLADTIVVERNVTIASFNGASAITRRSEYKRPFFQINTGGSLTLGIPEREPLTLNGAGHYLADIGTGILVVAGAAACTLRDGAIITGSSSHSGAVTVKNEAVFTMEGGEIRDSGGYNVAGGVNVDSGGCFVMTGGSITTNNGSSGGGVYVQNGRFEMTGGTIAGNSARNGGGGGVYIGGGGRFEMTGGTIAGNTTNGWNSECHGGGVHVQTGAAANITGGTITGNVARTSFGTVHGGGVYLAAGADYTLGASIHSNTPDDQVYSVVPPGSYYYNNIENKTVNGVTASVAYNPASPRMPGTPVTATVSFTGSAAGAGTFSVNLTSLTANLNGPARTWTAAAGASGFASETFIFTVPAAHILDLTLDFNISYTLNADVVSGQSARGGVAITSGAASGNVQGSSVTVTATPASGYRFVKWVSTDDDMAAMLTISNPYTFSIAGNTTLYAVFAASGGYSLSTGNVTGQTLWGTTTVHGQSTGRPGYSTVSVSASAASGYTFVKWVASNNAAAEAVSTNSYYSFTITDNTTLYAVFQASGGGFSLSAAVVSSQSGQGTAAINTGTTTGNVSGSSVTVKATANTGYQFAKWVASDNVGASAVSTANPYTFQISANTTLYAVFQASGGGGLPGDADDVDFGVGATVTTYTINPGDNLQTYLTGIMNTPGNYAVTITGEHTIAGGMSYTVAVGTGVTISLRGTGTIKKAAGPAAFAAASGGKLVIRGVTLDGNHTIGSVVTVQGNGTLVLETGSITGAADTGNGGGGVGCWGTFIMKGGTISGNSAIDGAGVLVGYASAVFTMVDGTIFGNTATSGGGGVMISAGTFTMTGGSITNNTASGAGGGVNIHNTPSAKFYLNSPAAQTDINTNAAAVYSTTAQVYKVGGTFEVNGSPAASY